jgi:enoyl-CoA hydratase
MPRHRVRRQGRRPAALSVAMTKLTVNRLAHALDDLASHMDIDQFCAGGRDRGHKEGVAAFLERRRPWFRGK